MMFLTETHSSPPTLGKPSVNRLVLLPVYPQASTLKEMVEQRELASNWRAPCPAWYWRNHPPGAANYCGWSAPLTHSHMNPWVFPLLNAVSATSLCSLSGRWLKPLSTSVTRLRRGRRLHYYRPQPGGSGELASIASGLLYREEQLVWLSTWDVPLKVDSQKLALRFIGPYPIKIICLAGVKLKFPSILCRVHPTFHVSRIKYFIINHLCPPPRPASHWQFGDFHISSASGCPSSGLWSSIFGGQGGLDPLTHGTLSSKGQEGHGGTWLWKVS